ncbi:MAG: flavin reductase family protein [Acidimicrobiia bacterium]|nr:flavin reductase family protein [Acidimicrobiia bacterium]
MTIDPEAFRDVLSNFAASVTVVTARSEDGPVGLTVSAFTSVSLDPPLILICIDHKAGSLHAIRQAGWFTVNFLNAGSGATAMMFASKEIDKFASTPHRPPANERAGPVLTDEHVVSYFECETQQRIQAGDHDIFVALVQAGALVNDTVLPMVYVRRRFAHLEFDT